MSLNPRSRIYVLLFIRVPSTLKEYLSDWLKLRIFPSNRGFAYLMQLLKVFNRFTKNLGTFKFCRSTFASLKKAMSRFGSIEIYLKTCLNLF